MHTSSPVRSGRGFSHFWYLSGSNKMFPSLPCWSPHLPGQGILIFIHQDVTALPPLLQQHMPFLTFGCLLSTIYFILEYAPLFKSKGLIPKYGIRTHFDPQICQFLLLVLQLQCSQPNFFSGMYTCTLPQTLRHSLINSSVYEVNILKKLKCRNKH